MENALALPGRISTVQTLSFSRGYRATRPQEPPKCSKVHGAESIFSRMISPTSNDCAEHRRLHQAGASVAGSGEADAGAMACSGARRLLGYALDTWD
ncbi:hypothetical protein CEE58_07255 [Stenotrophomonas maltophilia]|nr:hypothetical protein CEE58_07255 [Stenotrophomonas maltophilia]